MAKNNNLHAAKTAKNDEFYTQLVDIENELQHYQDFFKDKVVMCNCDDPLESNFTKYFILNFHHLGLKKLISTFYDINGGKAFVFEYEGQDMNNDGIINMDDIKIITTSGLFRTPLSDDDGFDIENKDECWGNGIYGSGDFRSKNVISYLKQADVVVTNPPFSLFRDYMKQLIDYNKKFLIIGNGNAVTYKEIFPYIKNNQIWYGVTMYGCQQSIFIIPNTTKDTNSKYRFCDGKMQYSTIVNTAAWFTNIPHKKRSTPLDLYKRYNSTDYPKYDNYDAIEVSKVVEIPEDYNGVMGVPISFLGKYCPTQFEIVGLMSGAKDESLINGNDGRTKFYIDGKGVYARILIRKFV